MKGWANATGPKTPEGKAAVRKNLAGHPTPEETRRTRFNALKRMLPNITQRMLTNQLRELEHDGLVARTIYPEVPPRVEYRLTEHGQTLEPVIAALKAWGDSHVGKTPAADKAYGSPD